MMRGWLVTALLTVTACQTPPPDMAVANALFEQGQINRARAEMGRYIRTDPNRANPRNEEVTSARRHILLIRRIKRIESQMVNHWKAGDMASARRSQGVIRFLHPAYAESAPVFALLEIPSPQPGPGAVSPYGQWNAPLFASLTDSSLAVLAPLMMAVINRQEILAVHLARKWESAQRGGVSDESETKRLHAHLETAYGYLVEESTAEQRREIESLADQIDQMLQASVTLSASSDEEAILAWTAAKGDLFGRLLSLKSTLTERSR